MTLTAPLPCLVCGSPDHGGLPCRSDPQPFPQLLPVKHPDDLAIEAFCRELKLKMADSRAKGRAGWDDPRQCTVEDLSIGLRVHVGKGDPRDVALYCMMLWARGAGIVGVRPPTGTPASSSLLCEEIDRQIAERAERERREKERRSVENERRGLKRDKP